MSENLSEAREVERSVAEVKVKAGLRKRLQITALFALPVIISVVFQRLYTEKEYVRHIIYGQFVLTSLAVLCAASRFYISRYTSLSGDLFAQVTFLTALGGLYIVSILTFVNGKNVDVVTHFGVAAFVALLFALRNWALASFLSFADDKPKKLLMLTPDKANLVTADGSVQEVPATDLKVGDIVEVASGEVLAADGEVLGGSVAVSEKNLLGEKVSSEKAVTHKVYALSVNAENPFRYRVEKVGGDMLYRRMTRSLLKIFQEETPTHIKAKQYGKRFFWAIWATALAIGVFGYFRSEGNSPAHGLEQMSAVLLLALPSFFSLSIRAALNAGAGRAADWGAVLRNSIVIEKIGALDTVIFDKTGTLTYGTARVVEVVTDGTIKEDAFIEKMATAESFSRHHLAASLRKEVQMLGLATSEIKNFQENAGQGVQGIVEGEKVLVGRKEFLAEHQIDLGDLAEKAEDFAASGHTTIFLAIENKLRGFVAIAYQVKPQAKNAVSELREQDLEVHMMSADNPQTAQIIARRADIKSIISEVGTNEKIARLEKMQLDGKCVAVVGDGTNDVALLQSSDVGIVLDGGAKLNNDENFADLYLISQDLKAVSQAVRVIRATAHGTQQNLYLLTAYHLSVLIAVIVTVIGLRSTVSPIFALCLALTVGTLACLNAVRLKLIS